MQLRGVDRDTLNRSGNMDFTAAWYTYSGTYHSFEHGRHMSISIVDGDHFIGHQRNNSRDVIIELNCFLFILPRELTHAKRTLKNPDESRITEVRDFVNTDRSSNSRSHSDGTGG